MVSALRWLSLLAVTVLATTSCAYEAGEDEDGDFEDEPTEATEEELKSAVSCSARSVTAYDRGRPYKTSVITVGGKPTALPTAHAFLRMQAAADKAGVSLSINSGFRSNEEQKRLYNCYLTKKCNNGNKAAKPGNSNHQNGRALDLKTSNWGWVQRNAGTYGFRATVPGERWHYEFFGKDPGGVCGRTGAGGQLGDTPATGNDPDGDEPAAPSGGGCHSATLDKVMPAKSCVQSESNELYYQCNAGKWYRGVTGNKGPYGACNGVHAL